MTDRNHPDHAEDRLLTSAISQLSGTPTTFTVKPWREIMPKTLATSKATERKLAERKLAAQGLTPPVHRRAKPAEPATEVGVDTTPVSVVQSGFSAFNPTPPEKTMTEEKTKPTQAEREEAVKAKIAAKEAKLKEAADKKAAKEAEKLAKAEAKQAESAEKKAAREAKLKELAGNGNYAGSMLALREAKARYVKGTNGRMRSQDEVATLFDAVEPQDVVAICMKALSVDVNPYPQLNIGQQSMNLRNKLRGALRKSVITLDAVREIRDLGGYTAKVEQRLADLDAKRKEREAKKAEKAAAAPTQAAA